MQAKSAKSKQMLATPRINKPCSEGLLIRGSLEQDQIKPCVFLAKATKTASTYKQMQAEANKYKQANASKIQQMQAESNK